MVLVPNGCLHTFKRSTIDDYMDHKIKAELESKQVDSTKIHITQEESSDMEWAECLKHYLVTQILYQFNNELEKPP